VLRRPVALVTLEAIAGAALAEANHESIAGDLGHDRGGRGRCAGFVALGNPLVLGRLFAERAATIPIHETKPRRLSDPE
jgi:hypothetical protein